MEGAGKATWRRAQHRPTAREAAQLRGPPVLGSGPQQGEQGMRGWRQQHDKKCGC
ncbi:hypothetical protein CHLRE_10g444094v5 [Chlamydomonas reinhardtii]|uniref:Uncharacterized protein n=1 Tax=Chlamydomonas reinhardtii TaxID=3055 RepID=A0A2K3DAP0_CHLRE|nr:uncharacterized protein CHLRE_10g444094v5 [Chlamydomonas reinhardtii]PNW77605.1 hypothetical protein CHLRE_10g444094v5 [Chlamydomonas reinhardtii]